MSLVRFATGALGNLKQTAAVAPSSKHLAKAMVEPLRSTARRCVIEFGPGTGVVTREILRCMPADSILLAFEINPRFVDYLRSEIPDERLQVVAAGAETATAELDRRGIADVDAVVSSLGIANMDAAAVDAVFRPLRPYLNPQGAITQFQYFHRIKVGQGRVEYFNTGSLMRRYFSKVRSTRVWLNFPPAYVITCRGALADVSPAHG